MTKYSENDIFIVTGATSGIGSAVARELNQLGAIVIAIGRNSKKLDFLKKECSNPENLKCEKKDLLKITELDRWVLSLSKKYGKLRGAILCAGIQQIIPISALNSIEKSKELFEINYFSCIQFAKGFTDRRANIGVGSSLVFLSSIASIRGNPGIIGYSASKGAINSAVQSLALEVASRGIRVNSILPGFLITEMTNKLYDQKFIDNINQLYPLGIGSIKDVVGPILFLLSEDSRWITGSHLVVDGGGSL